MAYAMVAVYGMNASVGQLSFPPKEEHQFSKPYSNATAEVCARCIDTCGVGDNCFVSAYRAQCTLS